MMQSPYAEPVGLSTLPPPNDDLSVDSYGLEKLEQTLRAYLSRPSFWLTFEPYLEQRFEKKAGRGRVKRFRFSLNCAALACIALGVLELILVPEYGAVTLTVRFAMLSLLLGVGWFVLPANEDSFNRELTVGALLAVLTVAQVALAWWHGPVVKPVYEGALLLLLPFCNQMTRVRYRVALPYTVLWLAMYCTQEVLLGAHGLTSFLHSAVLAALLASMTLLAKRSMELDNRITHVLKRLNGISEYRLAQANISKTRFLAAASHDLRQPVHALSLFIAALKGEPLPQPATGLVRNMERSVVALNQLLGALLDISKLDANLVEVQRTDFSIQAMLEGLRDEYAPQATAKGLRFTLDCEPGVAVLSDPALLENVLRNLLSNALRYTEAGAITLQCFLQGESVCISVRDTGIGIPSAQHAEIFREFVQLNNAERDRANGLGLGLAIVQRTLRLLEHRLELTSLPGEGSRFAVFVPRGEGSGSQVVVDTFVQADLNGMRVVVIDDDAEVRDGMHALLSRWGVETTVAGSADEALTLLGTRQPHVIIADFRLREGRTGAEAIAQLRTHFSHDIPALIVTGDTDPARLQEAKSSGHALLHKPAHSAQIGAYVRKQWRNAAIRVG